MPGRPSRRGLWAILFLLPLALVLLGYTLENWAGRRAWRDYTQASKERGVSLAFEEYQPPPVPDEQNFAQIPALKPLYDFVPGTQRHRDPADRTRVEDQLKAVAEASRQRGFNLAQQNPSHWDRGETMDWFALLGIGEEGEGKLVVPGSDSARPTTLEQAAAAFREVQKQTIDPLLDELLAARSRPYCRFGIRYDWTPVADVLLPHLGVCKGLARQAGLRAEARLALGDTAAAFEDVNLTFYLSDAFKGEPFLISFLIRLACREYAIQAVYDGVVKHRWSDAQLRRWSEGLAKDDFVREARWSLLGERAGFGLRLLDQLRGPKVATALENIGVAGGSPEGTRGVMASLPRLIPRGWIEREQVGIGRAYDRFIEPVDRWLQDPRDTAGLYRELAAASDQFRDMKPIVILWRHQVLASRLLPAGSSVFQKAFRAQSVSILTRVACALERYALAEGQYPDDLGALTPRFLPTLPLDPMSAKPLVYQKTEAKRFLLYSVGANFTDDGGQPAPRKNREAAPDQGDWVWAL